MLYQVNTGNGRGRRRFYASGIPDALRQCRNEEERRSLRPISGFRENATDPASSFDVGNFPDDRKEALIDGTRTI